MIGPNVQYLYSTYIQYYKYCTLGPIIKSKAFMEP